MTNTITNLITATVAPVNAATSSMNPNTVSAVGATLLIAVIFFVLFMIVQMLNRLLLRIDGLQKTIEKMKTDGSSATSETTSNASVHSVDPKVYEIQEGNEIAAVLSIVKSVMK